MLRIVGALPVSDPLLASSPVPCSKKIPYPARKEVFPWPLGSQANPDAGRQIEDMGAHATGRHAVGSTLHQAVDGGRIRIRCICQDWRTGASVLDIPVQGIYLDGLSGGQIKPTGHEVIDAGAVRGPVSEKAKPEAHIKDETGRDSPIVLDVGLQHRVAVCVPVLGAVLLVIQDGAARTSGNGQQRISEDVAGGTVVADVGECEQALHVSGVGASGRTRLRLLCIYK